MARQLHLDNIYRDRWQEYLLADGRVYDSRRVYWRCVPWEQLVAVKTTIRDKVYLTHCKHPGHRFFVVYRWGGHHWVGGERRQIREWAVGWSDGARAYMTDIDFKSGAVVRRYVVPVDEIREHIHPRVGGRSDHGIVADL